MFAGDTMEHNKLCSLWGGSFGKFPCHMCQTTRNKLDSPNTISLQKMTHGSRIKMLLQTNSPSPKVNGYYACQYNILNDLQYCDVVGGLNQALPPDILHAILLGYVTRLINGFAHLKKSNNDSMFVFSDACKEEVERDLLAVGRALSKQSDMDMP